jgi:hypothetical protein
MSRVALSSIRSLTFYRDEVTLARRSSPIPQLTCVGKACKLYTPDVVRCQNAGGEGIDVDWKVIIPLYFLCWMVVTLSFVLSAKQTYRKL